MSDKVPVPGLVEAMELALATDYPGGPTDAERCAMVAVWWAANDEDGRILSARAAIDKILGWP